MLITVTRTGGFAGGERTASLETECRADGPELERLAELALSAEGPAGQEPVPDGFATSSASTASWSNYRIRTSPRTSGS
ncbi:hypothetical protein [Streptomyces sp. NBC_00161]|uniref:hypothetical protein n=1 Tax=Streptomyces sp. NBC_00161 TaxID=2975671 RepID=UPI00386EF7E5